MTPMQYTVCLLLTPDLSQVLLQTKDRTQYSGRLNGVGGKMRPHESAQDGAIREIYEETGLNQRQLDHVTWLGSLILPEDCANIEKPESVCRLHFYTAIATHPELIQQQPGETEHIEFYTVNRVLSEDFQIVLAGDGDVQYFLRRAIKVLTEKTGVKP